MHGQTPQGCIAAHAVISYDSIAQSMVYCVRALGPASLHNQCRFLL